MNRYRITALEDVDVSVSDECPATATVRGIRRQVMTRRAPHWQHLAQGETCEVLAVHTLRGDLLEETQVMVPHEASAPVVIHEALKIEGLPLREPRHQRESS